MASPSEQQLFRRKIPRSAPPPPSPKALASDITRVSPPQNPPFRQQTWFLILLLLMSLSCFLGLGFWDFSPAPAAAAFFLGLGFWDFSPVPAAAAEGVELMHERTKFRLHPHEVPYGSGSGQQSVTGFPNVDDSNSYWVRTVKVSNVSLGATEQDIKEFFSFSGDIEYVEMKSGDEWSQIAYVTFQDSQGAETALLLSGATIVDLSVIITPAPEYELPPAAVASAPVYKDVKHAAQSASAVQKAEDVVSSMLAKGFILGKDAVGKAKSFDEKHQLTSTVSVKVVSFNRKIGLSGKIKMGTSAVNEKVKEMDQKFQVSEKTKSAFAAAEQKVISAGSAIMKNRYIFTIASPMTGAFNKVAKAVSDVGSKMKEKVVAEEVQHKGLDEDFAQVHLSETSRQNPNAAAGEHPSKPAPAQGLIL